MTGGFKHLSVSGQGGRSNHRGILMWNVINWTTVWKMAFMSSRVWSEDLHWGIWTLDVKKPHNIFRSCSILGLKVIDTHGTDSTCIITDFHFNLRRLYTFSFKGVLTCFWSPCRHRLYQDDCACVLGHYVKDLNVLGRDLAKTVVLDNAPHTYPYHVSTLELYGAASTCQPGFLAETSYLKAETLDYY